MAWLESGVPDPVVRHQICEPVTVDVLEMLPQRLRGGQVMGRFRLGTGHAEPQRFHVHVGDVELRRPQQRHRDHSTSVLDIHRIPLTPRLDIDVYKQLLDYHQLVITARIAILIGDANLDRIVS